MTNQTPAEHHSRMAEVRAELAARVPVAVPGDEGVGA